MGGEENVVREEKGEDWTLLYRFFFLSVKFNRKCVRSTDETKHR